MSSIVFHCVVAAFLLAFLSSSRAANNDYRCSYNIHVIKGQIIKAKESIRNGATFLEHTAVANARECYRLCCELDDCDLAQMQYKNDSNGLGIEKVCYMFHCGNPSICHFGEHDHYATLSYDKPEQKLKKVAEEVHEPAKKVKKPKLRGEGETKKPSVGQGSQGCPDGVPVAACYSDPCLLSNCPSNSEAICVPSYCGSCHSIFIDSNGAQVDCSGKGYDEETDLQSNPAQRPHQKITKKPENRQKDKESPLDTETGEENTQRSEEISESIEPKHHKNIKWPTTTKKPVKNKNTQEIKTKKPDILTKYFEVEEEVPTTEEYEAEEAKDDKFNKYFGDKDAELEQKLEDLTPSSQHPPKFPAKLTTTTEPTIHEWREFVDNNPNFPYTIPKSDKKTTKIPTTKRPTKKPTTEKHTEKSPEKVTTTVLVHPPKASENPKTTEQERVVESDSDGHATSELPPILDHLRPHKNGSDLVVIETRRLRIIENKAVLPLAIFLVLAILLLFVVALRLRIVKSKLKRRPFATDDADYLINGMYL